MSLRMLVMGAFAALVATTGLAAKLDDVAARAKALKEPVTLTFWQTHNAEETRTLKEIVGDFEKQYPMVRVAMDTVAFADAQTKFKTAAKAGTSPDVFRCEVAWTPEMAELGYLTPIDEYVTDADKAAYLAAPLKTATYRDEIWGLPQVTDCLALLSNRQMLQAAGIEPPKTMDELAASGAKLGDPEGKRHAFAYPATDSYFMLPFVWSFGGGLISDDGKQVLINNEGSVKGLQFMLDLRTRHKAVAPAFDVANDYNNQLEDFKNARVAMIFMGPWATVNILGGPAFKDPANLGIAPLPAGPAGTGSPIGGHNYVMSAACANPDLAFLFMDFLNKPENQAKFVVRNNLLPTKKAAYELPEVKGNRIAQEYGALLEKARTRPLIPQAGGIFTPLTSAYQDALRGAKTARQALDTVATEWKRLLEN